MTTFERINAHILARDGGSLISANQLESYGKRGKIDVGAYLEIEDHGSLAVFALYDQCMIGYAIFILGFNLKDTEQAVATNDVIFISKGHRYQALYFVRCMEKELTSEGFETIHYQFPCGHPFAQAFERDGYKPTETVYTKGQ